MNGHLAVLNTTEPLGGKFSHFLISSGSRVGAGCVVSSSQTRSVLLTVTAAVLGLGAQESN